MREAFLSYIWNLRFFDHKDLQTTDNEALSIVNKGEENKQAGPDFFNAKIKIGDTLWAGNVELHTKASDWLKHKHQDNPAYNNVILHVVFEADTAIFRQDGTPIPMLELQNRIAPHLYRNYIYLLSSKTTIPCEKILHKVDTFTFMAWLDRLLVERLERKTAPILRSLKENQHSWEETFYQFLARAFGMKVNAEPFELLAKSLPISILGKHKNQLFQIEALLFGQAGLLENDFEEEYPNRLKKEYHFLKNKFQLQPLQGHIWKFSRLRPPNFPTIRIAQFAALIVQSAHLFSKIVATEKYQDLYQLFDIQLSGYWETHYIFDKSSKKRPKRLGKSTLNSLIINTISPTLFVYGKERSNSDCQEKALAWLESLPSESNHIIKIWDDLGFPPKNALESQALLQLKNEYCNAKKCLTCAVGNSLLRKE